MDSLSQLFYLVISIPFVAKTKKAKTKIILSKDIDKLNLDLTVNNIRSFGYVSRLFNINDNCLVKLAFIKLAHKRKKSTVILLKGRRNIKSKAELGTWKRENIPSLAHYAFLLPDKVNMGDLGNNRDILQNNWLLSKYVAEIVLLYTGLYMNWTFINLRKMSKNDKYLLVARTVNKKRILGPFYHKYKQFFLNWFSKLTYLKDPSGITSLVSSVLLFSHLKKHRIIFFKINRILKIWYYYLAPKYGIKGYSFFFKGKLGKKGSVKKTKFFRKFGITSFTNKNVRVNYKMYKVITITGVIGAGLHVYYIGMFTLTVLYILFYILTLIQLLWYFEAHKLTKSLTQLSFTNAWQGISNYVANDWVFKFLILQLAGLPPVFAFFIKVNLLTLSLKYTNILLIFLIFLNLLMSVFFYLQIFSTTNMVTPKLVLKTLVAESPMLGNKKESDSVRRYNFYLFFCIISFFSFFSVVFFFDLWAIIYAFTM